MEKIIVLEVNIYKKSCHGCVKSENVLNFPSFNRSKKNYDSVGWSVWWVAVSSAFYRHFVDQLVRLQDFQHSLNFQVGQSVWLMDSFSKLI